MTSWQNGRGVSLLWKSLRASGVNLFVSFSRARCDKRVGGWALRSSSLASPPIFLPGLTLESAGTASFLPHLYFHPAFSCLFPVPLLFHTPFFPSAINLCASQCVFYQTLLCSVRTPSRPLELTSVRDDLHFNHILSVSPLPVKGC